MEQERTISETDEAASTHADEGDHAAASMMDAAAASEPAPGPRARRDPKAGLVVIVSILAVVVLLGGVAVLRARSSDDAPDTAAGGLSSDVDEADLPPGPTSTLHPVDRGTPLPASSVQRVMSVGSSPMWGESIPLQLALQEKHIDLRYVGFGVTGPLWNQKQWAKWVSAALDEYNPQIVIIEACCVYPGANVPDVGGGANYVNAKGVTVEPDTELMFREWVKATQELVDLSTKHGAKVWVVNIAEPAPYAINFYPKSLVDRISRLRKELLALNAPIIDWNEAVVGKPNEKEIRDEDGVHYSFTGSIELANYTVSRIIS